MSLKSAAVQLANKLLVNFDAEIRRRNEFSPLQSLIRRYHHPAFFFVQIGANDGLRADPINKLVVEYKMAGLAVEPLPDLFETLSKTYSDFPQIQLANVAIHRTDAQVTLYRVSPTASVPDWAHGIASLNPNHHQSVGANKGEITSKDIIAQPVKAVTLEALIETHQYQGHRFVDGGHGRL